MSQWCRASRQLVTNRSNNLVRTIHCSNAVFQPRHRAFYSSRVLSSSSSSSSTKRNASQDYKGRPASLRRAPVEAHDAPSSASTSASASVAATRPSTVTAQGQTATSESNTASPAGHAESSSAGLGTMFDWLRRWRRRGRSGEDARYNEAARKITGVMVAIPILIVTSWALWQRCKWFAHIFISLASFLPQHRLTVHFPTCSD